MSTTPQASTSVFARVSAWRKARKARLAAQKPPETFLEHTWSWVKTFAWALSVVTIVNGLALASFTVPTGSMEDTVLPGEYLFVNKAIFGPSTPQIIPFLDLPLPFYKTPPIVPPAQGDVIVFIFPGNRDQVKADRFEYYLKRCVAVAGDSLVIRNGRVYVNGTEFGLPEHGKFAHKAYPFIDSSYDANSQYGTFPPGRGYTRDNYGPIRVPKEGDVVAITPQNFDEWAIFMAREGHDVDRLRQTVDGAPITSYTVERDYVFGMGDNRDNSLDSRFWGFIPEEHVVGIPMFVYWSWELAPTLPTDVEAMQGSAAPYSLWKRLTKIRWNRLGTIIR